MAEQVGIQTLDSNQIRTATSVSVVIPAYNEERAIADDIRAVISTMDNAGIPCEVIVVDDGSTDGTRRICEQLPVRLVSHPYNKGGGAARKTGIRQAKGDIVVITDGDGTYPIKEIPQMLALMDSYDMVIGARKCESGTYRLLRRPAKAFLRLLASFIVGRKIPDLNSGMRVFRRELALQYFYILPDGHSWVSTISLAFLTNGLSVKYFPIDYYPRKGRSSFRPVQDSAAMGLQIIRSVMYFRPLRVFLPIGLLLLVLGVVRSVYDATRLLHIKESDIIIMLTAVIVITIGLLADLIVKMTKVRS